PSASGFIARGGAQSATLALLKSSNTWKLTDSINTSAPLNELASIAAVKDRDEWAVGRSGTGGAHRVALTMRRGKQGWEIVTVPAATGRSQLKGVAVVPATVSGAGGTVWAVGFADSGGKLKTLILRYSMKPGG